MEKNYEIAFQIILHAGNSKSNSMLAIEKARGGEMGDAHGFAKKADNELNEAHHIQTDIIQKEASGEGYDVNLIMVHAQDHLTMAMMMRDVAKEMIRMYTMIGQLQAKIGSDPA